MPNLLDEIISAPTQAPISVRLEPAFSGIQALLLLTKVDEAADLDEWMVQTAQSMTPEERHRNKLVVIGMYFAIAPDRSWPSFPAYLQGLKDSPARSLVNKMLAAYQAHPCMDGASPDGPDEPSVYASLGSLEDYLGFLRQKFDDLDEEIETEAYRYVTEPEEMKKLVIHHLTAMWEKYLAPEWQKVKPMLQTVVNAFDGVDFRDMDRQKAARWITGQDVYREKWSHRIEEAKQIIYVPSAHAGPYFGRYQFQDTLWVLYKARLPKNAEAVETELSRADILIRLNTLADDSRLRILQYISENGETRSQTLIDDLNLSQSAASRHLSVLSGMGYLKERRCEGAKCYVLNRERFEETLRALSAFLPG